MNSVDFIKKLISDNGESIREYFDENIVLYEMLQFLEGLHDNIDPSITVMSTNPLIYIIRGNFTESDISCIVSNLNGTVTQKYGKTFSFNVLNYGNNEFSIQLISSERG